MSQKVLNHRNRIKILFHVKVSLPKHRFLTQFHNQTLLTTFAKSTRNTINLSRKKWKCNLLVSEHHVFVNNKP